MRTTLLLSMMASMLMLISCDPIEDKPSGSGGDSQQFLTLHLNTDKKIGKGSYLALLKVKGKETTYEKLNDLYSSGELRSTVEISNNRVAIGLHTDFNPGTNIRQTNGAWFDISNGTHKVLPLLPAGKDRYAFCSAGTVKVSKNGFIFYLSSSSDSYFNSKTTLVRYNPKKDILDTAKDPASFAVNQPEKGWDTETGQFKTDFYLSNDGRYVYGAIETFGVDGGAIHWDYKILFKYDFDKQEYTRLGEVDDKQVFVYGLTSDGSGLLYNGSTGRKLLNLNSNKVAKITVNGGQGFSNTSRWNSSGYCSGETNNTIGIYNVVSDESHSIKTPGRPYYAQFSADGKQLYFMLESSKDKYLCRTNNLTKEAVIDTLCTLSSNVTEFMVIK